MLDWLEASTTHGIKLTIADLAIRLLLSLAFGAVVAGVYVLTQRRTRSDLMPMATTLVLLSVLIAMVTMVIGNNVARAFSLAGALAIIRFRTVVDDTRDTAFVIFAVVVGMAVGADQIAIPLLGVPVVASAAFLLGHVGRPGGSSAAQYTLEVRLGLGCDPARHLKESFAKHLCLVRLRSATTARQGSALDLNYLVSLRREEEAILLVAELNKLEGVQTVELRQA